MPTKLGFQLHDGAEVGTISALERLSRMRPVAVLGYDRVETLDEAYAVLGSGPIYAFQRYGMEDIHAYIARHSSIRAAVEHFIEEIEPLILASRWTYHCTFSAQRITKASAQFEALAIELIYDRYETRLCIGNFASGTPNPQEWQLYKPALLAAARYQAVVGLNEFYPIFPYVGYGPNANLPVNRAINPHRLANEIPYPQGYDGVGQYVGRYRYLRDACHQMGIPVRILITGIGAGRVLPAWMNNFGGGLSGWRSLELLWQRLGFRDTHRHYFQDLVWLDQHVYRHDPEVVGACIYAWNAPDAPQSEIGDAETLLGNLEAYLKRAEVDQPAFYEEIALTMPQSYRVIVPRLRIREAPSLNSKYIGGFENNENFEATHYSFSDGMLWLKHRYGWSVYTALVNGNPNYQEKYLEGPLITTPAQDRAVNNFVGTLEEVRQFIKAHRGQLFYIAIDPNIPPDGARQFSVTVFPANQGRRIIDQLHPEPGDPLMTPGARQLLREAGQL